MARYQYFYDVKKRIDRFMMDRFIMNGLLLNKGYLIFQQHTSWKINTLMIDFYVSGEQQPMPRG